MITEIFKTVVMLSAVGTAVILILLLMKPVTEKRLGAVWQYYIWILAIVVMICPIRIKTPFEVSDKTAERIYEVTEIAKKTQIVKISPVLADDAEINRLSAADMAAQIWFAVTLIITAYKIFCHYIFKISVRRKSVLESKTGRISIYRNDEFSSPFLMGIIKPMLIIPSDLSGTEELEHVLMHERMHYKRFDILYKWAVVFVKSIHWFNPFVYVLSKEIDNECEISCDAMITGKMSEEEKKSYMNTILLLMESKTRKIVPFTSMANNRRIIKKRFKVIKKSAVTKLHIKIIAVSAAMVLALVCVVAGAFVISLPDFSKRIIEGNRAKTVMHTQKYIAENKEISAAVNENTNNIYEHTMDRIEQTKEEKPEDIHGEVQPIKRTVASEEKNINMEVVELAERKSTDSIKTLVEQSGGSYINGQFNYEEGPLKVVSRVKPDENGIITLHFTSDINEVIEVEFSENQSQHTVWGVRVPADSGNAYSFTGLDKNKEYDISLYSPAKINWKLDSSYIIY